MKAIDYIDLALKEVDGAELASHFIKTDPLFVDVVVAPYKKLMPWFPTRGFALVPPRVGLDAKLGLLNQADRILVRIDEAFGGRVSTDLPDGWPQKITALVTAGFIDLDSPAVRRRIDKGHRMPKRKNPNARYHSIDTFSGWMRQVNGILLREIGLGSWQLTRQRYKEWFVEGMRPSTAANIVIDGVSTGQIKRKYKRNG